MDDPSYNTQVFHYGRARKSLFDTDLSRSSSQEGAQNPIVYIKLSKYGEWDF